MELINNMPLSLQERQSMLSSKGYDPKRYDFDEDSGQIYEVYGGESEPSLSPPILNPNAQSVSSSSKVGPLLRAATQSLVPSLGGVGAGAIASSFVGGLKVPGLPIVKGVAATGAGLATAFGAGSVLSELQNRYVPENIKQKLFPSEQDISEHPIMSRIGELLPLATTFNIPKSVSSLVRASKDVGTSMFGRVGSKALSDAELQGLRNFAINTGVNVGTQAGLDLYKQYKSKEPFSLPEFAGEAATGLLLNEPTKLGQRIFGFQPSFRGVTTAKELEARALARSQQEEVVNKPLVNIPDIETTAAQLQDQLKLGKEATDVYNEKLKNLTSLASDIEKTTGGKVKWTPEQIAEQAKTKSSQEISQRLHERQATANLAPEQNTAAEVPIAKATDAQVNELFFREYPQLVKGVTVKGEGLQPNFKVQLNTKQKRDFLLQRQLGKTDISEAFQPGPQEQADIESQQKAAVSKFESGKTPLNWTMQMRELARKVGYDMTGKTPVDFVQHLSEILSGGQSDKFSEISKLKEEQALPPDIERLLAIRGIKKGQIGGEIVNKQNEPILGPTTGKPIAGSANIAERKVNISRTAGADTPYHEAGHIFVEDLMKSSDLKDRALVERAIENTSGKSVKSEDYFKLSPEEQSKLVEPLMDYIGVEGAHRAYNKGGIDGIKQWFKDWSSRFTSKGAEQQLSARLTHETPFGSREVIVGKESNITPPPITPPTKFSEESKMTGPEFMKYASSLPQRGTSMTKEAINKGLNVKSIDEINALKQHQENAQNEFSSLMSQNNMDEAQGHAYKAQYFREAHEAATGTGGVGSSLHKNPNYIPPITKLSQEYATNKVSKQGSIPQQSGERIGNRQKNEPSISNSIQPKEEIRGQGPKLQQQQGQGSEGEIVPKEKLSEESKLPLEEQSEPKNLLEKKPALNVFTSVTDKIAAGKGNDYTHTKVSTNLRNYFDERDTLIGKLGNSVLQVFKNFSPSEVNNVYKYRYEKDNALPSSLVLTPREKELNNQFQTLIERPKQIAGDIGLKVKRGEVYSIGGVKPEGYLPNLIDPQVLFTLDNKPSSPESKYYRNKWSEWLVEKGLSPDESRQVIKEYEGARREYGDTGGPEFAALRRAEGYGLPWELMDKNPARAISRYARRAASDLSFFKHIQNDPDMRIALGIKDQYGNITPDSEAPKSQFIGNEREVQNALGFIYGSQVQIDNPRLNSLFRLGGNLVMGTGTAIRNLASIPTQLAPYDISLAQVWKAFSGLHNSRQRAFENNAVKADFNDFERVGEYGNPDKVVRTLDSLSNFFRQWSGRNLSDKFEGEIIYAIGEEVAKTKLAQAQAGDNSAKEFLQRIGFSGSGKDYKLENSKIEEVAKGFVNVVRGTYGPQGLPSWALQGNIAPFVALNRFSVEKWNNVYKDVVLPMKQGNIKPFLKYSLTGIATGAMIEQLNELLSGKKGADPTIPETLAAYAQTKDPELIASKVIGLAQLASYAGIVGDFSKLGVRAIEGKSLAYSNPLSFPLYTLMTDTFGENTSAALQAIRSGEDPIDILAQWVKTVGTQSIQSARYIDAYLNPEETKRKEQFRDIRVYKEQVEGPKSQEIGGPTKPNVFQGHQLKEFKKTEDIQAAAAILPQLIKKAIDNAKGDPYTLKAEFRKIKENNFQIIPSPEQQPIEFYKYFQYLQKTQGKEKASQRLADFLKQQAINKIKSSMVP